MNDLKFLYPVNMFFRKKLLALQVESAGRYIERNLSHTDRQRFYECFQKGKFRKSEKILEKALKKGKRKYGCHFNEVVVISKLLGVISAERILEISQKEKGKGGKNMLYVLLQNISSGNGGNGNIALMIGGAAVVGIGVKVKKHLDKKSAKRQCRYCKEDEDMIELIHQIAEAYRSRNRFFEKSEDR